VWGWFVFVVVVAFALVLVSNVVGPLAGWAN